MQNLQRIPSIIVRIPVMVMLLFMSSLSWAQDKSIDINLDVDKGGAWYSNPIVWIVGGAVFILLLVALLKGGSKSA